MRNRIKRRDNNQSAVVNDLRRAGCSVVDLSQVGGGVCDILVGANGRNYLFEIKNADSSHGVSRSQLVFMYEWQGQSHVIESADDALVVIGQNNRL